MPLSSTGIGCIATTAKDVRKDILDDYNPPGGVITLEEAIIFVTDRISGYNCWNDCEKFEFYNFNVDRKRPIVVMSRTRKRPRILKIDEDKRDD